MLKVASSRPYPRTQERVDEAGHGRGPDGAGGRSRSTDKIRSGDWKDGSKITFDCEIDHYCNVFLFILSCCCFCSRIEGFEPLLICKIGSLFVFLINPAQQEEMTENDKIGDICS